MTTSAPAAGGDEDPSIQAVAATALELIADGSRIGLGSGRAATVFIGQLGKKVHAGLRVSGVPTSLLAAAAARKAGIPLIELGEGVSLDITIDGADEVAPNLDLVKGWGGALVRERIVALASASQVILVGAEKLVRALGERGRIPVEVVRFARWPVAKALGALDLLPTLRLDGHADQPFVTDNGNLLFDCAPREALPDARAARELERALLAIPGVVDTGLFLGTAHRVLVGHANGSVATMDRADQGQNSYRQGRE